jgi:hypothetical protein
VTDTLDDRTVTYVLESQPLFEDLRQVAAQLAGLLVLAATGSREASPEHPMLAVAEELFAQTIDGLARVKAGDQARAHVESLRQAAVSLRTALTATRALLAAQRAGDFDAVLVPLRAGYRHLEQATRALPGFRMVAFEQGCCAGGHIAES